MRLMTWRALSISPCSEEANTAAHTTLDLVVARDPMWSEKAWGPSQYPVPVAQVNAGRDSWILLTTSWDAIQLKKRGFKTRHPCHRMPFNSRNEGSKLVIRVIGCRLTQETRVQNSSGDVARALSISPSTPA